MAEFFNVDIFALLSIDCVSAYSFYQQLEIWIMVPILITLAMVLLYLVATHTGCTGLSDDSLRTMVWQRFLLLLFVVYPSLCSILLATFKCREIEGKHWLVADLTEQCYTNGWTSYATLAGFGVLVYSLGVPAWCYVTLCRNQHKLFVDSKFERRYGFLYSRCEENFWFWELTEMLRK